jgi:hypothetical protein
MVRIAAVVLSAFCLMAVIGCSQYDDDYQFSPRPVTAQIPATQPQDPPPVMVQATVVGVRYGDEDNHIPQSVEIRLQMDNNGPDTVMFDPMSMELRNPQLIRLGPPIVRPPTPITLNPSQSAYLSAYFPFPPGVSYDSMDLSSLQLRWRVQIGPRPVVQVVNFTRVWAPYYGSGPGPYWYYPPPPPVVIYGGWGWGYGHHWR